MVDPALDRLGYTAADIRRVHQVAGDASLEMPQDLRRVIDSYEYMDDWRVDYRVQSMRSSLNGSRITCIDAAILAYGLLELLFPHENRRLLAIHRRDRQTDEECGHCVALHWGEDGRIGSLSKSTLPGLGHRDAVYAAVPAMASSYAAAYVAMGFEPLYFGVATLEEVAFDLDWRFSDTPLNQISDRLLATYEYGFDVR
jgi:hypothetical protein